MRVTNAIQTVILVVVMNLAAHSLSAAQMSSNPEEIDTIGLPEQACQDELLNCRPTSRLIPNSPLLINDPDTEESNESDPETDLCCFTINEEGELLLSLELLLSNSLVARDDDWSVITADIGEESETGVQTEIDLLEVETVEGSLDSEEPTDLDAEGSVLGLAEQLALPIGNSYKDITIPGLPIDVYKPLNDTDSIDPFQDYFCTTSPGIDESITANDYPVEDIPVYTNKKIEAFIRLYTGKKRDVFIKAIERYPIYQELISSTLMEYELPLNLAFLAVVESNLNPNARSRANAIGLWQFMSYTGKHFGLSNSWWHDDRYDPERSTKAAAHYLKQLHHQFKGDWELAMAAYNSGSGTVRRAIREAKSKGKSSDYWSIRLPRETRGYVPAFYAVATIFSNLEKYGFNPVMPALEIPSKQLIEVGGGISLKQVATIFGLDYEDLSDLNPRLRFRGLTPPTFDTFEVAFPTSIEVTQAHLQQLNELKENRQEEWKIHKVQQGETLWSISRYYRIPMNKILDYNRLQRKNLLRIGQKLMLPVPMDWDPPKMVSKTKLAVSDIDKIPGITKIHVVKKGETLWQISQRYNISIEKIRHWNRRVLGKYLKVGTEIVLKVPTALASNSF